jgi:hypothetical protein
MVRPVSATRRRLPGRLVHLTEHHRDLVQNLGLFHLVVEVVALAGTLADAGEYRVAAVGLGDVVDQFHHVHGLADAGTAEQADLAALGERAHQVDNLDARRQQFGGRRQLVELRRAGMNRTLLLAGNLAGLVDRATQHVHDATQRTGSDRHRDQPRRSA